MVSRTVAGLVAAALAALAVPVRAQPAQRPSVSMQLDPCVPVDRDAFGRIVAIELGTSIDSQYGSDVRRAGHTSVRLGCVDAGVELVVDDGVTRKTMTRVLDVASLDPSSRTRLLALATAEFVVASWIELTTQPEPIVEPAAPPPPPAATEAARRTAVAKHPERDTAAPEAGGEELLGWDMGVAATLAGWTSHSSVIPGVGLRMLHRPVRHFAWALSPDFSFRRIDVAPFGTVELTMFSLAGAVLAGGTAGAWEFLAGPGVRFGAVRMAGLPADAGTDQGRSTFGAIGGPLITGRILWRVHPHVRLGLEAEAGLAILPIELLAQDAAGATQVVLELGGAWIRGGLSVSGVF